MPSSKLATARPVSAFSHSAKFLVFTLWVEIHLPVLCPVSLTFFGHCLDTDTALPGGRCLGSLSAPFSRPPITPPYAARLSATEPRLGARSKTAPASPLRPFAPVTVLAFADFFQRCRVRLAGSHTDEASSIRQGDGQRFQKKAMKTTKTFIEASAPANGRPSSVAKTSGAEKQPVSVKYNYNRELPIYTVLNYLRTQLPQQYELAEIVGKWIWLEMPNRAAAATLARLGFHWNQRRQVWQHPCGACAPFASHPQDPRAKYGSYFAADVLPA